MSSTVAGLVSGVTIGTGDFHRGGLEVLSGGVTRDITVLDGALQVDGGGERNHPILVRPASFRDRLWIGCGHGHRSVAELSVQSAA